MNINDVAPPADIPQEIWVHIREHQSNLHDKYKEIEGRSGLGYGILRDRPVGSGKVFHLDDQRSQYYLKDMFWRVVEELAEADEAKYHNDLDHYLEELIDALHFMVEIFVVLEMPLPEYGCDTHSTTYHLGLAANCLKQKPWKQTHMVTDADKFEEEVKCAFISLIKTISDAIFDVLEIRDELSINDTIYALYYKKAQVNQFRQRSNY